MADILRLSRPLLGPSLRPAMLSPSQVLIRPRRHFTASTARPAMPSRRSTRDSIARKNADLKRNALMHESNSSFLLPATLVAPPIWRYPRHPKKFFHMLWLHSMAKAQSLYSLLGYKLASAPTPFSRSRFKANRSNSIPTAKALHVRMNDAFAAGDRETLRAICTNDFYQTMVSAIDARPKGVRTEWELLRYDQTWYYPRLADWRVAVIPRPGGGTRGRASRVIKQAVVSIASVQRIARYDDSPQGGGAKIKGSERVRHMLEHLVLQSEIDPKTYQAKPWRIWGTIPENTYESWREELANFAAST